MGSRNFEPPPCPHPLECSLLINVLGADCLAHPAKRLAPGEQLPARRRRTPAPRRTWARGLGDARRASQQSGGTSGVQPAE